MRTFRLLPLALAIALGVAGCQSSAPSTPAAAQSTPTKPAPAATGVVVSGSVAAPPGLIAPGGGNLIAAGGGNLIGPGGGNYRLLALDEQALAGATVYLADASGKKVETVAETKTDAKGAYTLKNVPKGGPYMVVADCRTKEGKAAPMRTVVKPSGSVSTAHLGVSSTMVATKLLKDGNGTIANFDAAAWDQMVSTLATQLTMEMMPADMSAMSDMNAIGGVFDKLSAAIPALKDQLEAISAETDEAVQEAKETVSKATEDAKNTVQETLGGLGLN